MWTAGTCGTRDRSDCGVLSLRTSIVLCTLETSPPRHPSVQTVHQIRGYGE